MIQRSDLNSHRELSVRLLLIMTSWRSARGWIEADAIDASQRCISAYLEKTNDHEDLRESCAVER